MGALSGKTMEIDVRAAIAATETVLEEDRAMNVMEATETSRGKEIRTTTIQLNSISISLLPRRVCRPCQ